jgi:hypothetical protein
MEVSNDNQEHSVHACEVEVTFPTNLQAEQAVQVLQVDQEPTDRVAKSFQLVKRGGGNGDDEVTCLKVYVAYNHSDGFASII